MAISTVRVQINGTWTNLTYNSATGAYEATITAPSTTSYNRTGGYYPVTVEATNTVGTKTTVNDSHSTLGASCKLRVQERIVPVVTINSPTSGARVTSNKQPIVFTITDESGGSGIDLNSLSVELDDRGQNAQSVETTTITNGYRCTFVPGTALTDGSFTKTFTGLSHGTHKVVIVAKDAAGKTTTITRNFTVDTSAPVISKITITPNPADAGNTMKISVVVTG